MLARVLVLERRPDHDVDVLLGRQRHGPGDAGAGALRGLDDLAGSPVYGVVVIRLEPDPDLLGCNRRHWCVFSCPGLSRASGAPPQKVSGGAPPRSYVLAVVVPPVPRQRKGGPRPALCGSYSMISETTPEPTVRPPSRMANRRPWSMAIGWISSIVISMLSPGMTISVPSGRFAMPVTSVVRK